MDLHFNAVQTLVAGAAVAWLAYGLVKAGRDGLPLAEATHVVWPLLLLLAVLVATGVSGIGDGDGYAGGIR
jgi:hypothetical protein